MVADSHLFRPFSSFNPENSSLKTLDKEDNFRLPEFSELDRTLHSGGIEDKLWKEKLTSSSLSTSGRREKVNSSDFKSREHHENWTHDNHKISQTKENAETPMLLISMKISPNVAAEHLSTTSNSGTGALMYRARYDHLVNDKSRLSDPCERSHKVGRTSQENTALTDGVYENLEKLWKKRSHSMMESYSSRDNEENNHTLRMEESVNECCTRDHDEEVGDAGRRSIAISDTLMLESKSDSSMSPGDVVDIIGLKFFWQVRKTIAHQQRIFARQVFELHRLIKVQRLVAKLPEILSEEMLYICNYSTKISPEKELHTQNISEATSSLMKQKIDSQRPNSRHETADAHPKLPLLECDAKKKGHITPRSTPGPCTLGSGYFHPGNECIIPVRSPSEGHFYKPHAGAGPRRSPVYASCGVPRLCVIDRDFTMPTLSIQPSSQHGSHIQPCAIPEVQTPNSSKSMQASKGSDVHESIVGSPPTNRVHGDAPSLFPVGSPFQASYKEIPSNNTEMQGIQVIKVIPHNPKLACESAARIFQSLQEERQKRK